MANVVATSFLDAFSPLWWGFIVILDGVVYKRNDGASFLSTKAVSMVIWPAVFEWYSLLSTFPRLVARHQNGPKLKVNGPFILVLGYGLIAAMVVWPLPLFGAVWVGSTAVFVGILLVLKIKSAIDWWANC